MRKSFGPKLVHALVVRHVGEVDVSVDHVLQGQAAGDDDALHVLQGLAHLGVKIGGDFAVGSRGSLAGDIEKIIHHYAGRVRSRDSSSGRRDRVNVRRRCR